MINSWYYHFLVVPEYFRIKFSRNIMRSFIVALAFLLVVSYLSHILVTLQLEIKDSYTVTIDRQKSKKFVICHCRCCILNGALCSSIRRYDSFLNQSFTCQLCTTEFCQHNGNATKQCHRLGKIEKHCIEVENRPTTSTSFVSVRPFLQWESNLFFKVCFYSRWSASRKSWRCSFISEQESFF